MKKTSIKRALISVSDKTGIVEFAKKLSSLGVEIISTGGTSVALQEAQIKHKKIEELTGLASMLDGRVKTLHPIIHAGILGDREQHANEMAKHNIDWIDLVVVNFYPFAEAIKNKDLNWNEAIEYIDVGGPTMVRAAAKNAAWVGVIIDPTDYDLVLNELKNENGLSFETRKQLAKKVFALTSQYDAMIHDYFSEKNDNQFHLKSELNLSFKKHTELRYGENPHQKAYAFQMKQKHAGILSAKKYQGKPLSYNNILDAEAAWSCVSEFDEPTCVIVKHANPCGVASAESITDAYREAHQADPLSAFGGIIALNRECTKSTALAMIEIFSEVILAPSFSEEALAVFASKPNLRVLEIAEQNKTDWEMKFISDGVLVQEKDRQIIRNEELKVVTNNKPHEEDLLAMMFGWRVLKHVKSNGILIAKNKKTMGIGAGQVSRIDAVNLALQKAGENSHHAILASDAFFPFRDSIDRIANTGVRAIIQPGGGIRDQEVIDACNEHQIAMVFTGKRCFRH